MVVVPAQAGVREVRVDCGRRWGAGELGGLIGKAGGAGAAFRFRWFGRHSVAPAQSGVHRGA